MHLFLLFLCGYCYFLEEVLLLGLTGIMIASIPENSKEIGNSLTQLFYNLIGYLPSPFIYGLVCKFTGGSKSRWGLAVLVLWGIFGVVSLYFARKHDFDFYTIAYNNMDNGGNIKEHFLKKEETSINRGDLPIKEYSFNDKSKMLTKLFGRISQL